MNAPPFPTNPAVGQSFGNWTWNGVRWVCGTSTGITVIQTMMLASGPYMPSPGLISVNVKGQGGGGGGGGALGGQTSPSTNGWIMAGGSGASGGYSESTFPAALVLGGVNVTIGQGGPGGDGNPPYNAAAGTATSFGALLVANGGGFGYSGVSGNQFGPGAAPAAPGVGQVASPGNAGSSGIAYYWDGGVAGGTAIGAQGGAGFFGGQGQGTYGVAGTFANGANGSLGAGGDGAVSSLTTQNAVGGTGGPGWCLITEYCWTDAAGDDCLNPPINVNARVAVTQVPWPGPGPCPPGWGQGPYVEYDGE